MRKTSFIVDIQVVKFKIFLDAFALPQITQITTDNIS
jgi:hypothetical protein